MLVVFDLDGTLIDSTRALLESHKVAWKSVGVKCPPKEDILSLTGLPLVEIMQKLGPEYDPQALAKVYSQTYMEATRHEKLFDGITELLANKFRAAVATGGLFLSDGPLTCFDIARCRDELCIRQFCAPALAGAKCFFSFLPPPPVSMHETINKFAGPLAQRRVRSSVTSLEAT